MKTIQFIFLTLTVSIYSHAQSGRVGIGTDNPQTTLDVNGDMNISKTIYLGGESPAHGNAGQFIVSGGENAPARWETKQIPGGYGESYSLTSMDSFSDNTGVDFNGSSAGNTNPYNLNDNLSSSVGWKELPGLTNDIIVIQPNNKVNLHLQTMIQLTGGTLASFACGFFLNDLPSNPNIFRLKGVRTDVMIAPSGSYKLFNMNSTLENLPAGQYKLKVACIKRNIENGITLGIGKSVNTGTLSGSMAESTLNVYILEKQ